MTDRTLILASASPRRREILENLGYAVRTGAVPIDETPLAAEAAEPYVLRMAQQKNRAALAAASSPNPNPPTTPAACCAHSPAAAIRC